MIRTYILNRKELANIPYTEDIFSEDRKEKIAKLKRDEDKELAACAELLLIYAVRQLDPAAALPLGIRKDARDKLQFTQLPYYFNLSHARDYAACVISDQPVGIDIEYFRVKDISYADRMLHPDEASMMAFISNPNEKKKFFYECWVAKESYLKNLGIGLIVRPRDFMVSADRLKILQTDVTELKGHHSTAPAAGQVSGKSLSEKEQAAKNTLHENLSFLEKRYVHVFEPGEVRGSDWKFDASYRMAVTSMEKDSDSIARLVHGDAICKSL